MIDVCLVLEGTYPYVAGGVSTWVHQLIGAMRHIKFGIVYVAAYPDPSREIKYQVPDHVVYLKELYLHDYFLKSEKIKKVKTQDFEKLKQTYQEMILGNYTGFENLLSLFRGDQSCFDGETFFSHKQVYALLNYFYDKYASEISYIDFFWSWRGMHLPLMQIFQAEIPQAKVYHSVSTGYAGMLAAIARMENGGKFFLTEHGIYTHERLLEISQANWIYEPVESSFRPTHELSFFKKWWVGLFKCMSAIAYKNADQIFTLYEGNRVKEILEGAAPEKISIVPNGIDVKKYANIKKEKLPGFHIGLIGRVVNIKDIKTFIQAAKIVHREKPDARFYVVGPVDEEAEYFEECKLLVDSLELNDILEFTGRKDVQEYYSFLDLVVLTSLSEAQPYIILEAGAAGIPIVASDVGACREMLYGRSKEDRALGQCGIITEVANPESTAQGIMTLLNDKDLYKLCSEVARTRVPIHYDQDDLLSRYLNIYEQNI